MASRKISDLAAATGVIANTLMVVVDTVAGETKRIAVSDFVNSIPSNATFQANVSVLGRLTTNAPATFGSNASMGGNNYLSVNNILILKNTTPSNSTNVSVSTVGALWTNGTYLMAHVNATHIGRIQFVTNW